MEDGKLTVRKSGPDDLGRMLAIYEKARTYMAKSGNPVQWGTLILL